MSQSSHDQAAIKKIGTLLQRDVSRDGDILLLSVKTSPSHSRFVDVFSEDPLAKAFLWDLLQTHHINIRSHPQCPEHKGMFGHKQAHGFVQSLDGNMEKDPRLALLLAVIEVLEARHA